MSDHRKTVWDALSEFYLDTELMESDFDHITEVFKASGFTLREIEEIDLYEVFPVLQANLLSVAGEWAGFNREWLHACCESYQKRRTRFLFRLRMRVRNRAFYWMRKRYWDEIKRRWN